MRKYDINKKMSQKKRKEKKTRENNKTVEKQKHCFVVFKTNKIQEKNKSKRNLSVAVTKM